MFKMLAICLVWRFYCCRVGAGAGGRPGRNSPFSSVGVTGTTQFSGRRPTWRSGLCVSADYLAFMPPNYNKPDERLVVNVSFNVKELSTIDSFNKDFTLLISINMAWEDNRVQWKDDFTTPEGRHELILNIKHLE